MEKGSPQAWDSSLNPRPMHAVLCKGLENWSWLRPRQDGRHFPNDIFKCIFLNENILISIKILLNFVPKGPMNNIPALVQIMVWRRSGDKPLSEPMMVSLLTHICVTRPQWVIPSVAWLAVHAPDSEHDPGTRGFITVASSWAPWHLKSPASPLLAQQLLLVQKRTPKLRITGLCVGNSPVTGDFPTQKASKRGKRFHLMTSSCLMDPWRQWWYKCPSDCRNGRWQYIDHKRSQL